MNSRRAFGGNYNSAREGFPSRSLPRNASHTGLYGEEDRERDSANSSPDELFENGADPLAPEPAQRASYAGGYTVVSPDERKRRQILNQAQRETELYEQYRQQNKPQHVSYVGTAGRGQSEAESRRAQIQTHTQYNKTSRLLKDQERRAKQRDSEEKLLLEKKMAARNKTELNAQREKEKQELWRSDMMRKNQAFLDKLEAQSKMKAPTSSPPTSQPSPSTPSNPVSCQMSAAAKETLSANSAGRQKASVQTWASGQGTKPSKPAGLQENLIRSSGVERRDTLNARALERPGCKEFDIRRDNGRKSEGSYSAGFSSRRGASTGSFLSGGNPDSGRGKSEGLYSRRGAFEGLDGRQRSSEVRSEDLKNRHGTSTSDVKYSPACTPYVSGGGHGNAYVGGHTFNGLYDGECRSDIVDVDEAANPAGYNSRSPYTNYSGQYSESTYGMADEDTEFIAMFERRSCLVTPGLDRSGLETQDIVEADSLGTFNSQTYGGEDQESGSPPLTEEGNNNLGEEDEDYPTDAGALDSGEEFWNNLQILQSKFPGFDESMLFDLLHQCNGSVEQTVKLLEV